MKQGLRRFVAVSIVVTLVDLGVLLAGRSLGLVVPLADAVAVVAASGVSWVLHRTITLADDPFVRWVRQPRAFVGAALLAGALDVVVTSATATVTHLAVAKVLGLVLAGGFRLVAYRSVLLTDTRRSLGARRADLAAAPGELRLTVVVPAFGEAGRIGATIARLDAELADIDHEVVVVDDGSPDATAVEAETAGARVVRLPDNRGKGAAVRAGVLAARGRTVAFTAADLAYDADQGRRLLVAVEDGWDVAVGTRWHRDSESLGQASVVRRLSSRLFNALTATVLLGQYRDTQCGCKAFRADAAALVFGQARLDGFAFDVELLHLVERFRLSLVEVPVRVTETGSSTIRVATVAGSMVRDLFRIRRWAAEGRYDDPR